MAFTELSVTAFQELFDLNGFITEELPGDFLDTFLQLNFGGQAPLTALVKSIDSEVANEDQFHWIAENPPIQAGDITAGQIYTDQVLATAYTSGGAIGNVLYVKCAAAVAKEFTLGTVATLRVSTQLLADVQSRVVGISINGASSYIAVKLLEADNNGSGKDISDVDRIINSGSAYGDAGMPPQAINYKPFPSSNFVQLFKNALEISGRAEATKTRQGRVLLQKEERRKMVMHMIGIETAFWRGQKSEGVDEEGHRLTTTEGVFNNIRTSAPQNWFDYRTDTDFAGLAWEDGGTDWIRKVMEYMSYYKVPGSGQATAFCGSAALSGISRLADDNSEIQLIPGAKAFGTAVDRWLTVHGEFKLVTHPLFNREKTERNIIALVHPSMMTYKYMKGRDTDLYEVASHEKNGFDGIKEEYMTDCGLRINFPVANAVLDGIGQDNPL